MGMRKPIWRSGDRRPWKGSVETIPRGWKLCDDMIDRAIVGAGGLRAHGEQFGANKVRPPAQQVTIYNHTITETQMPYINYKYQRTSQIETLLGEPNIGAVTVPNNAWSAGVATGRSTPYTVAVRARNDETFTNMRGGGSYHSHGVGVTSPTDMDVVQASVAILWIEKL